MRLVCAGALGRDGVVSMANRRAGAVHVFHVHPAVTTSQIVLPYADPRRAEISVKYDIQLKSHIINVSPELQVFT